MRYISLLFILTIFSVPAFSQNYSEAVRYSNFQTDGTARFIGVGGSMSAIGGDLSTTSTNPAGIAVFRKSEISVGIGVNNRNTKSVLNGQKDAEQSEGRTKLMLNNLGIVFASQPQSGKIKTLNFAISANKLNNFNENFSFGGFTNGTIMDRFTELANQRGLSNLDDFAEGLAWDSYAFSYDSANNVFHNDFENSPNYKTTKQQYVYTKGANTELGFTLATNIDEKLMFGLTIGVPFFRYEVEKTYSETDDQNLVYDNTYNTDFKSLKYYEYLNSSGTGINIKGGLIWRISQMLRFGASIHSPTWYKITDNYTASMQYTFVNSDGTQYQQTAEPEYQGEFTYRFASPWKANAGVGVIIGKSGFISADVDYLDFRNGRYNYRSSEYATAERAVNDDIRKQYRNTVNFRLGGELALEAFRLRAGFGLNQSPYFTGGGNQSVISGGVGYRSDGFYLDLGVQYYNTEKGYYPYAVDGEGITQQSVSTTVNNLLIVLSVGFKL